ncbi:hypothetical protein G7Y89_g433 [Cudoniella acicularis]|uniref:Uncharacterized protein n=1 Tax=Cudoniella acicularis TaxID=354080 RepID=A0A8H4RZ78_9HELO|nr:hypothetical protein G7Y89_g433 [Cudoniella acicularis]
MAGRQRTFDLIPMTLVNSDGPRRPMTSKQAKKAYQQKNKGPRVSQTEQRRRDAEELAQQKLEYEKERAAAKAKAAREKKAAKAEAERQARKKMGLPEPSKFVRASQPTISRFVKTSSKRTWQEMEDVAENTETALDEETEVLKETIPPCAKRVATDVDSGDEFGEFPSLSQTDILEKIDSSAVSINGNTSNSAAPLEETQKGSDCEFGEFPSPSQSDLVETKSKTNEEVYTPSPEKKNQSPTSPPPRSLHGLLEGEIDDGEFLFDDLTIFADMAATQLLSEAADAETKSVNVAVVSMVTNKKNS